MKKLFGLSCLVAALLLGGCHHSESTDQAPAADATGDQSSGPAKIRAKPMNIKGQAQATREGNQGVAGTKTGG